MKPRSRAGPRARKSVFIAKARAYDAQLEDVIARGLTELGLGPRWLARRSVMLKPNLVEPHAAAPHVNTHPAVVGAAACVFRRWGARDVFVAEGQGHVRDSQLVLDRSGMRELLDDERLEFFDLNHGDVRRVRNRLGRTGLEWLWLPRVLRRADVIVSIAKMKTHHWAGVTLSMKNFFGVLPGICYGWPKNLLHFRGIANSILDIVTTVRPQLAIVDGIVAMEGDGPIMGQAKKMGVIVMGTHLPAVDATCARLMMIPPERVEHLGLAAAHGATIDAGAIDQRGEALDRTARRFELLDHPLFDRYRSPG